MPKQHTYCIVAVLVAVVVSLGTLVFVESDTTCPESVTAMWGDTYCPRSLAEALLLAALVGGLMGSFVIIVHPSERAPSRTPTRRG